MAGSAAHLPARRRRRNYLGNSLDGRVFLTGRLRPVWQIFCHFPATCREYHRISLHRRDNLRQRDQREQDDRRRRRRRNQLGFADAGQDRPRRELRADQRRWPEHPGQWRIANPASSITRNISGGLGGGISNLGTTSVDGSQIRLNVGSAGGGIATSTTTSPCGARLSGATPVAIQQASVV